jgi:hypothetical protein
MDNSENYCIYTNIPYSKLKDREETIEYGQFRELLYLSMEYLCKYNSSLNCQYSIVSSLSFSLEYGIFV